MSLWRFIVSRSWVVVLLLLILPAAGRAQQDSQQDSQQPAGPPPQQQVQPTTAGEPNSPPATANAPSTASDAPAAATGARVQMSSPASSTPTDLLIGPGDEGEMRAYGLPELTTHFRVESTGDIYLPLIGKYHIAGLSAETAQNELRKKYEEGGFLHNPHITVFVKEYTTQGISVLGEVNRPGIYSALNARRLYDVFLIAGGLTNRAGKAVTITHSKEPNKPVVVKLENGMASSQASNIEIQPGDTINVARAGVVYVIGEVNRPGQFVMESTTTASLLQMLALASGPTRMAKLSQTRVLRRTDKGLVSENIDLSKIMQAKASDIEVHADDIIFVPSSRGKAALERGGTSVLGMLTSLAVYRF